MAQDESPIPVNGESTNRNTADLLPRYFRTVANKKFLSSTLDQMMVLLKRLTGLLVEKMPKHLKPVTITYKKLVITDKIIN